MDQVDEQLADCWAIVGFLQEYISAGADENIISAVKHDLVGKANRLGDSDLALLAVSHSESLVPRAHPNLQRLLLRFATHNQELQIQTMKPKGCIIFVHGIGSSFDKSWKVMADLLESHPVLSKKWDIQIFDYSTKKLALIPTWLGGRKYLPVPDLAKALKSHIDRRCQQYDHVVIIGHSMGGLVTAKYLVTEKKDDNENVKGAMFFAAPWEGSHLAAIASTLSLRINWQARYMIPRSAESRELGELWNQIKSRYPHMLVIGGQDRAVPYENIPLIFRDNIQLLHEADHTSIIQATDYTSDSFILIESFLNKIETSN